MYNRNLFPGRLLPDAIDDERKGNGYIYDDNDKDVLKRLCDEINQTYPDYPYKFDYLCEISIVALPTGSSSILLKYIHQFESESCRAFLLSKIICDDVKIKGLDKIVMDLYHHFRSSSYYVAPPKSGGTAHIYIAYDNAFRILKSSKIMSEIVELLKSRREVYILALTAQMIAKKWAPKELEEIMVAHLMNKKLTRKDVNIPEYGEYHPSLEYIAHQTSFTAIKCLQYYPSEENLKIIMSYTDHPYEELAKFAQEYAKKMETKLLEKSPS